MAARTAGFVLSIAMPLILVRVFDPVQFGAYKQAFIVVLTAQNILPFSVGVSAFYYLPRVPELRRALISNIVLYHAVIGSLALLVLLLWPGLLTLILGSDVVTPYAPVIGGVIGTWVFATFLELIATANQDVKHSTAFIVLAQLSRAVLLVCAAVWFGTVEAVLYGALIQGLLQTAVLLWYLQSRFPHFWRQWDRNLAIEQMRYVLPFGITGVLITLQLDVHNYIVAHGFSTFDYAIYAVGTAQLPLVGILSQSINTVMQSRMSRLQQENDREGMLSLMLRSWRTLILVLAPAFVMLLVLRREFITVLYTQTYLASVPIFGLNLLTLVHASFITDSAVRAHAEYRFWFMRLRFFSLLGQVLLSFLLLPYLGIAAPLAAMVISLWIERTYNAKVILNVLGFSRRHLPALRGIGLITLVAGVAGLATAALLAVVPLEDPRIRLAGGGAVFSVAYVLALLGTGVLTDDERTVIHRFAGRALRLSVPGLTTK